MLIRFISYFSLFNRRESYHLILKTLMELESVLNRQRRV